MQSGSSVKLETKGERIDLKVKARQLLEAALGFGDCEPRTLDALVSGGNLRTLGKGEALTRRGEPFDMLSLIVEGSLEASHLRHDGHRHLVSFLQAGDVVGMISMLDGLGHVNDLYARGGVTTVLVMPGEIVRECRLRDPALGQAFELQLAFRSRLLYERLSSDPSLPLESRIARLLQTLGALYGRKVPEGISLEMRISQADLGDWMGVSRQRANFAVQQLRDANLISLRYSAITITDPKGLSARAMT